MKVNNVNSDLGPYYLNIVYLRMKAGKRAEDKSHDWWHNGYVPKQELFTATTSAELLKWNLQFGDLYLSIQ